MEKKNHLNSFTRYCLNIFHRCFAFVYKFYPTKYAKLLEDYDDLTSKLKKANIKKVMIILSKSIERYDLHKDLMEALNKEKITFLLYTSFSSSPTVRDIEDAALLFQDSKAEGIIALGGGTIIDAAKGVGILIKNKGKLEDYKGVNKIKNKIPFLIAIPTTCGSGSETSVAAMIKCENGDKYSIISNKIVPSYALLDPEFIKYLPKEIFAYCVMDTLTHAIESYINYSGTSKSNKLALEAIKTIFTTAVSIYEHNKDDKVELEITLNQKILEASYYAARSFSKGMVGHVHSLSHGVNSKYPHLSHGKINAIILPEMLKEYLKSSYCIKKLNDIAEYTNLANNRLKIQNALNVIDKILLLNGKFNIPQVLVDLKEEDFLDIEEHAYQEAHILYCTPLIFDIMDYDEILNLIKSNKD